MKKKVLNERAFTFSKFLTVFKLVGSSIKRHPIIFFSFVLFTILNSILAAAFPLIVKGLFSTLVDKNVKTSPFFMFEFTYEEWIYAGIILLGLFTFVQFFSSFLAGIFSRKSEIALRKKVLKHLIEVDISYYSKRQIGSVMTRVISDTQFVGDGFNNFFTNWLSMLWGLIVTSFILINLSSLLTGVLIGLFFLFVVVIIFMFFRYRQFLIGAMDEKRKVNADMTDRIMNIRLVKSSGTEMFEVNRNKELNKELARKQKSSVAMQSAFQLFNSVLSSFLPMIMLIVCIFVYNKTMTPFALSTLCVTMLSATGSLVSNLMSLTSSLRGMAISSNCATRVNDILKRKSIILFNENPIKIESINNIKFENVTFNYPEEPHINVLSTFNFEFEKGKSYAIVGETGVGKSTIAKMLLRFYDATTGKVLVNDIDIKDLDLSNYLSHVGYVEQEPQILYGTFMDNITYSVPNKTKEEVYEAAKKSQLHEYVMSLKENYETLLGERGLMLSGGQKQRLVIARLFLKNPDLLILDEATSALDNIIEKEIQKDLDELIQNRTTIVIAHRLSTIKKVDKVIVLDRKVGILEIGTFDELKKQPGKFQKLYNAGLLK
ncbi:ABC transporter ATP-binding protein [Spiroplasma tabanidicola]|uniref:ATP-binding cassette n=1 Tax=Spiroplasma tabanidicola TaxID=324079 RepID=A0A6I6C433_9MOLU|nr:ABC transporter ATP-binding protein [Spiroplasma tabanidicola]QGS51577.1 ATP-binding cassette [Spiroplasma tabanidicola]